MDDEYIPTKKELYDLVVDLFRERQHKEMENTIISHMRSVYGHGTTQEYNEKFDKELTLVSPDIFRSFLIDKGVSGKCASCNSDKLSTPESGSLNTSKLPENFDSLTLAEQTEASKQAVETHVSHISLSDIKSPTYRMNSYFVVNCLNCGYLNLYRAATVLKWLENQKVKDDNNE